MQPSSVIFLVVIAIWAAYLVQHWVGRREHLATARTVDRFSESMRILDRGKGLPESDAPTVAAASSARVHRNALTVSRGGAEADPSDFTRGAGRRLADRVASTARSAASTEHRDAATQSARQAGERARELGSRTVSSVSAATARATSKARASAPASDSKVPFFGRATRGVLVIGASVFTLVSALLASLGAVRWVWPVLGVVATGLAMWWLRRAVAAAIAARRRGHAAGVSTVSAHAPAQRAADATRAGSAPAARRGRPAAGTSARPAGRRSAAAGRGGSAVGASAPGRSVSTGPSAPTRRAPTPTDVTVSPEPASEAPEQSLVARGSGEVAADGGQAAYVPAGVYDIDAFSATTAQGAPVAAEEAPGGWSPVPVPPPTYTLKAKATYPSAEVEETEDDVVSPYATVTDVTDYAAQRARLASG